MITTTELTTSTASKLPKSKPRLGRYRSSTPEVDKLLGDSKKWIALLEKWETEGDLIRRLCQLSRTGRDKKEVGTLQPDELDSILENEIRPLKFSIFDFSNDVQRMKLFPKAAKKKIEVQRIKLHRIGERYDEIKHRLLLGIIEHYPISII